MHKVCQHIAPRMLNEDQSADEIKNASQAELKGITNNGFPKCFDELYKRWPVCCCSMVARDILKQNIFQLHQRESISTTEINNTINRTKAAYALS
ncbi:hypothetical protein TNCV_2938901 [Trichonephila clavipes]|nr:hypothetical protein TNCV_2938901 [Trichonephila clavipes]